MPFLEIVTGSGFGSLLGIRHALEPDHLAAVSTLVSRERSGFRAAWLGVCWGVGHTFALLAVGAVLVGLRAEMPETVATVFEFGVAIMLVALGARTILTAARDGSAGPATLHRHGVLLHVHGVGAPHLHVGRWTLARRPLLIGAVHGLAGSGALTALVLTTLPSTGARLAYIGLFGLGSTVGMAMLSGFLGWPLARLGANRSLARGIAVVVGTISVTLGVVWGIRLL
jgi:hypothetical protein